MSNFTNNINTLYNIYNTVTLLKLVSKHSFLLKICHIITIVFLIILFLSLCFAFIFSINLLLTFHQLSLLLVSFFSLFMLDVSLVVSIVFVTTVAHILNNLSKASRAVIIFSLLHAHAIPVVVLYCIKIIITFINICDCLKFFCPIWYENLHPTQELQINVSVLLKYP